MGGRAKFPLTALAVGAGVAMATSVSAAGGEDEPTSAADSQRSAAFQRVLVTAQRTKRPIRGVVAAVQPSSRRKGTLFVSLHGVKPGTSYRVDGNKASCADSDGDVDGADFLIWQRGLKSGRSNDDVSGRTSITLGAPLRRTRSVRIYAFPPGGTPILRACLGVDVWEHA